MRHVCFAITELDDLIGHLEPAVIDAAAQVLHEVASKVVRFSCDVLAGENIPHVEHVDFVNRRHVVIRPLGERRICVVKGLASGVVAGSTEILAEFHPLRVGAIDATEPTIVVLAVVVQKVVVALHPAEIGLLELVLSCCSRCAAPPADIVVVSSFDESFGGGVAVQSAQPSRHHGLMSPSLSVAPNYEHAQR